MRAHLLTFSCLVAAVAFGASCGTYEGPPAASLPELFDGELSDPSAPVLVSFTKQFDERSLRMKIVRYLPDVEGNLPDELPGGDSSQLSVLYSHEEGQGDLGGRYEVAPDGMSLRIFPSAAFPTSPRLALLIEPGFADREGHASHTRKRLLFGYRLVLRCNKPSPVVTTGKYFILFDVKKPVATQVQLWASFVVDTTTGQMVGQFTNADRNLTPNRCPFPCKATEACRLQPAPACVIPSERAGTVDEFSDFIPNPPPSATGYSFTARGCVEDLGNGNASMVLLPADILVSQPQVTLRNAHLSGTFALDTSQVVRATGAVSADEVLIGTVPSGRGEGTVTFRKVADAEAAAGIPDPPP